MTTTNLPELSKAELDLMRIVWQKQQQSAREIHDQLDECYSWTYSTTRTMLERMVSKGYLNRQNFHGIILYQAEISKPVGLARLVRNFADRVLQDDHNSVVALFARGSALTAHEVDELSNLLDELHDEALS